MRGHGVHMWMCGAMIVGAVVLGLVTGSAFAFLPVLGCILMMVVMMSMMGRMGGHGDHRGDDPK